jgi:hypothetical protein
MHLKYVPDGWLNGQVLGRDNCEGREVKRDFDMISTGPVLLAEHFEVV